MKTFLRLSFWALTAILSSAILIAHPMGNFSISHYSKLRITERGIELQYVLDLAEIPTLDLLRTWNVDRTTSPAELHRRATRQASYWLGGIAITVNGKRVIAGLQSVNAQIGDGAGNLPILRVDMRGRIGAKSGVLTYQDLNYPERAGWKEIVVLAENGASLLRASQSNKDLSMALTQYPPDPTVAPPQDLRAELKWKAAVSPLPVGLRHPVPVKQPLLASIPQPNHAPAAIAPATMTAQGAPKGSVVRGDYLSRLLSRRELSPWMMLMALTAAFGLGALHALTPGHGKAIVAAYLVGSRGTLRHAAFLGAMVTLTHTIVVFALGLATLFLFRFIVPERITVMLGALSGLSIVMVGATMLRKRLRQPAAHGHTHADGYPHHHHGPGGHTHSYSPLSEQVSWRALMALGAGGGLTPCESALVLLLGAIALGRVGFGLLLLVSFSLGLAAVLMSIGALVLYAKNLFPESSRSATHPFFRWASIASPAFVMVLGVVMTAASLGWIQSRWLLI